MLDSVSNIATVLYPCGIDFMRTRHENSNFFSIELRERIIKATNENRADWNIQRAFELYPKLIVIIPRNGFNVASLNAYDPTVQPVTSETKQTKDGFPEPVTVKYTKEAAGQIKRDFSTPLFKTSHKAKVSII